MWMEPQAALDHILNSDLSAILENIQLYRFVNIAERRNLLHVSDEPNIH
jgi:hypothetical protein